MSFVRVRCEMKSYMKAPRSRSITNTADHRLTYYRAVDTRAPTRDCKNKGEKINDPLKVERWGGDGPRGRREGVKDGERGGGSS